MVVDYNNRRLMELVEGRTVGEMEAQLASIDAESLPRNGGVDSSP